MLIKSGASEESARRSLNVTDASSQKFAPARRATLSGSSGFEAETLVYKDHWGHERAVSIPLPGGNLKWWDLWSAADKAIIESDDIHHVFIEDFQKSTDGKTLFLRTGS